MTYDDDDRVASIAYPAGSRSTFSYNALGTRVSRSDPTGSYTYLRDGAGVTDPVLKDGRASYVPGVSETRNGVSAFYLSDRLGSMTRLGVDRRSYDAFGLPVSSYGSDPSPFGYAGAWGYQTDASSGLMLLGNRYYDPSTGRFLTRDPIQDGRNWYVYVDGNPLNAVDPEGLQGNDSISASIREAYRQALLKARDPKLAREAIRDLEDFFMDGMEKRHVAELARSIATLRRQVTPIGEYIAQYRKASILRQFPRYELYKNRTLADILRDTRIPAAIKSTISKLLSDGRFVK